MTHDIIDERFIGALHVRALTHAGLEHDQSADHVTVQAGTLDALMAGGYEGDTTIDELLRLGDTGIGTIQQLDGELIVIDGEAWTATADGTVRRVAGDTRTPFAVVCHFTPTAVREIDSPLDGDQLRAALDAMAPPAASVIAVRVDGAFTDLAVRSVERQEPPYRPLREVVAHQHETRLADAHGTLIGFRFPDATAGVEVPGHHLHFISDDRRVGGHVMSVTLLSGRLAVDPCDELHVELPEGITLGVPGSADRDEIARLEGDTAG